MKMAERHPQYDGFEAGVIVLVPEVGEIIHREGCIVYEDEQLVGGWAKAYRKDRSRPFYEEVKLSEYDTKKSMWVTKPATMIRKVALVHALRESFPATFGSLYDESEVPVAAEASYREVENEQPEIGAMQPRKLKPKKEQPEPFAVETTDTNDDPFCGDAE